jgi:Cytochrome c554 and c-prime
MGWLSLLALLLAIGLLSITPGKILSKMFSIAAVQGLVAGRAEQPASFGINPFPATECGSCHREHFDEWSRSFHARSLTSESFLRTFPQYLESVGTQAREDPEAAMACFNCHAPLLKSAEPELVQRITAFVLAKDTKKLDGFEVGCVACHGDQGRAFSGPIRNPQNNPFHTSKFSPAYEDGSICGGCHTSAPSSIPCSDVYPDWKKSRAAKQGATCQSCHMAERSGIASTGGPSRKIHSHLFPGGRSAFMLERAVDLRLKAGFRKDRLEVTATVRNLAPHRVPDG